MNSLFRTQSGERFQDGLSAEQNLSVDFSIESTEMGGKLNQKFSFSSYNLSRLIMLINLFVFLCVDNLSVFKHACADDFIK